MALCTVAQVKSFANISASDTSRDAQFAAILQGVTAHVKQMINRDLEQQTYTEFYSGDGTPTLLLRQWPAQSITNLWLDDGGYWGNGNNPPYSPFGASTLLVQGVDYALKTEDANGSRIGAVYRINGAWNHPTRRQMGYVSNQPGVGNGNIKIIYQAGLNPIPYDIQMAVAGLVMRVAANFPTGMMMSDAAYEDASAKYFDPVQMARIVGSIEDILAQYQEVAV